MHCLLWISEKKLLWRVKHYCTCLELCTQLAFCRVLILSVLPIFVRVFFHWHLASYNLPRISEAQSILAHWGRVMHICVSNLTTIGSDNGLSPDWRQAIIWTNAGILFIGPKGTILSEILIEILTFSFKKMHLKVLSAKWRPFCLSLCWRVWMSAHISLPGMTILPQQNNEHQNVPYIL